MLVDKGIVFQGVAQEDGEDAIEEANARVISAVKGLFAETEGFQSSG